MKFSVCVEIRDTKNLEIEAKSYEEAVAKAYKLKPKFTTRAHPTWVGKSKTVASEGEYEFEIFGPCGNCKKPIVIRPIKGQPWTYGENPDPDNRTDQSICYPCFQKITKRLAKAKK